MGKYCRKTENIELQTEKEEKRKRKVAVCGIL